MAGGIKTGGRKKGSVNKISANLRKMIAESLSELGGVSYLVAQGKKNPNAYLTLLGKTVPKEITGKDGAPLLPAAELFRPTELPREALIAIASGRKAYYKDGSLVIEDAPAKTNGHATNGSADGSVH